MEEREYKYDAFISYRHCELDKFVAENLHRILESYELPKNLKEKLNIEGRTFKRIFRDQEELPLSSNLEDPIIDALNNSKYLIVICSPRLNASLWCKKEIETFKKIRGRENIFCVLIEGEPDESFPEEVLFDEKEVKQSNGKVKIEKIPVEPLAADVRGKTKGEVLKKIKEEKLRLAAAMYKIDYDDLKQRHKLREQKRKMHIAMAVSACSLLFLLYTSLMLIKITNQQKILKNHQALSLASEAVDYLKEDNRHDAIKTSYESLTKLDGVKMPYTPEGEYALSESLGLYDVGSSYKVVNELKTKGIVDYIKESIDSKYAAVYDESDTVTLFNTENLKVINTYDVSNVYFRETSFTFIGDNIFSYVNNDGNISLINIKDNKLIREIKKEKDSFISIRGDSNGKYLVYLTPKNLFIYDIENDSLIGNVSSKDEYKSEVYYSEDRDYIFAGTSEQNFDITKADHITMHIISTKDAKEVDSFNVDASYIMGMYAKGNSFYMLYNNSIGNKMNGVVVSYNFIDKQVNWTNIIDNKWSKFINRSYAEGYNNLIVGNHDTVTVYNEETGSEIYTFNLGSEIINMYSFTTQEVYLVFLKDGSVIYVDMNNRDTIEYKDKYEFNIDEYTNAITSFNGLLLVPYNENRVVLYEQKTNKDAKEVNTKIEYKKSNVINTLDFDKYKEEYKIKNKNLVETLMLDDNKELLFVNYTNNDIAIYSVKDKKLLNTLTNVGKIDTYFGKDKTGRTYIGNLSNSYILDKNYNKVGHIKGLIKLDNDKVILSNNGTYYSTKIYSLNDMLKEASNYLKK